MDISATNQGFPIFLYEELKPLDRGSFEYGLKRDFQGVVTSGWPTTIAIKKVPYKGKGKSYLTKELRFFYVLSHENIVKCFGVSEFPDSLGLVMETTHLSLKSRLKKSAEFKNMKLSTSILIVKQILEGLEYLHDNTTVHGDLKPSNVLMSYRQGYTYGIKLCNFGMYKYFKTKETVYTAPEVHENPRMRSFESDIFSAGKITELHLMPQSETEQKMLTIFISVQTEPDARRRLSAEELLGHPLIRDAELETEKVAEMDGKIASHEMMEDVYGEGRLALKAAKMGNKNSESESDRSASSSGVSSAGSVKSSSFAGIVRSISKIFSPPHQHQEKSQDESQGPDAERQIQRRHSLPFRTKKKIVLEAVANS